MNLFYVLLLVLVYHTFLFVLKYDVLINEVNPANSEEWKKQTGAYIDDGFLIDYLTPEEYFAFLGKICSLPQSEVDKRLQLAKDDLKIAQEAYNSLSVK